MSGVQEQQEIRFRLPDGSDIGPKKYSQATTVATLKECIIAEWPKEMNNGPRIVNDLKLINAGRILENNKTLAESSNPICDLSGVTTTMHVVIRPPSAEGENGKKESKKQSGSRCVCVIL